MLKLTEVRAILREYNIHPSKRLGQNFLIDQNIKNKLILIDPLNEQDIFQAIAGLLDSQKYQAYCETIASLELARTWDDVISEHIKLFEGS